MDKPSRPSRQQAEHDLRFMNEVVLRTHARVDPHLFHFVHWGWIVLIWYPIGNWLQNEGRHRELVILCVTSVVLGIVLSLWRELRMARRPRVPAENTFVSRQLGLISTGCVGTGILLSALGPAMSFIRGEDVPILWGLVYANLAFMTGVVYDRELVWAGLVILAGVVLAMIFPIYNGYILGPFMGLGMLVPGLRAEARVKELTAECELEPERV